MKRTYIDRLISYLARHIYSTIKKGQLHYLEFCRLSFSGSSLRKEGWRLKRLRNWCLPFMKTFVCPDDRFTLKQIEILTSKTSLPGNASAKRKVLIIILRKRFLIFWWIVAESSNKNPVISDVFKVSIINDHSTYTKHMCMTSCFHSFAYMDYK